MLLNRCAMRLSLPAAICASRILDSESVSHETLAPPWRTACWLAEITNTAANNER
jgi:hypothetical protein